jgi:hypothetical protein
VRRIDEELVSLQELKDKERHTLKNVTLKIRFKNKVKGDAHECSFHTNF